MRPVSLTFSAFLTATSLVPALERLPYSHPGLVVDLGVVRLPDFPGGAGDGRFYFLQNPRR